MLYFATLAVLPLTGGEPVSSGNPFYRAYLLLLSYLYFGWCWTHGGQTLGMRAWRLRVTADDGGAVTWGRALARFAAAILSWLALGAGFLWILVDRDRMAWHDHLSRTRLIFEERRAQ